MNRAQLLAGIYTGVNEVSDLLHRAGNIAALKSIGNPAADEDLQCLHDALQELKKTARIMLDAAHEMSKKSDGKSDEKVA